MLPYLTIVIFAVLEGEIYYSKVCADAMVGKLNWAGVWCAGAVGGSLGDQIWFYLLRANVRWLDRFPRLARYRDLVSERVTNGQGAMPSFSETLTATQIADVSAYVSSVAGK